MCDRHPRYIGVVCSPACGRCTSPTSAPRTHPSHRQHQRRATVAFVTAELSQDAFFLGPHAPRCRCTSPTSAPRTHPPHRQHQRRATVAFVTAELSQDAFFLGPYAPRCRQADSSRRHLDLQDGKNLAAPLQKGKIFRAAAARCRLFFIDSTTFIYQSFKYHHQKTPFWL